MRDQERFITVNELCVRDEVDVDGTAQQFWHVFFLYSSRNANEIWLTWGELQGTKNTTDTQCNHKRRVVQIVSQGTKHLGTQTIDKAKMPSSGRNEGLKDKTPPHVPIFSDMSGISAKEEGVASRALIAPATSMNHDGDLLTCCARRMTLYHSSCIDIMVFSSFLSTMLSSVAILLSPFVCDGCIFWVYFLFYFSSGCILIS